MLETGEVDALIVQNPFAMGYLAMENANLLMKGRKTEKKIDTETTVITRDNMFDEANQKILFSFSQN